MLPRAPADAARPDQVWWIVLRLARVRYLCEGHDSRFGRFRGRRGGGRGSIPPVPPFATLRIDEDAGDAAACRIGEDLVRGTKARITASQSSPEAPAREPAHERDSEHHQHHE